MEGRKRGGGSETVGFFSGGLSIISVQIITYQSGQLEHAHLCFFLLFFSLFVKERNPSGTDSGLLA